MHFNASVCSPRLCYGRISSDSRWCSVSLHIFSDTTFNISSSQCLFLQAFPSLWGLMSCAPLLWYVSRCAVTSQLPMQFHSMWYKHTHDHTRGGNARYLNYDDGQGLFQPPLTSPDNKYPILSHIFSAFFLYSPHYPASSLKLRLTFCTGTLTSVINSKPKMCYWVRE